METASSTSRARSASATCSSRSGSRSPSAPSGGGPCPALIVAFIGYVVARVFVDSWLRQRYQSPLSDDLARAPRLREAGPRQAPGCSTVRPSDRLGHAIASAARAAARVRERRASGTVVKAVDASCQHGHRYTHAIYQPASRFWLFQGIETALFGGLAVALIAVRRVVDARARHVTRSGQRCARISAGAPKPCRISGIPTPPSARWCVSRIAISVRDEVMAVPLSVCRWRTPCSLR